MIRGPAISGDYLQTYEHCVAKLQAELDLVSINVGVHMVGTDVQNEHVAWWPIVDGLALRYVKFESMHVRCWRIGNSSRQKREYRSTAGTQRPTLA